MNRKLYSQNIKQNKSNREISIPLFIPLTIIILLIILVMNISNSNPTVIASANENVLESDTQSKVETIEVEETEEETLPALSSDVAEEAETNTSTSDTNEDTNAKTATYTVNGEQYTVVGILNIPSLGIEYPILSETSTKLLKVSLTKYWGANPNEVGNMVVVGHNYKDNKFFSKLPNIEIGKIVKITDLSGKTLDYKVYDTYVIDPYDNSCTSQLTDGKTEITLITCYYENGSNHATKRFVVKARVD